MKDFFTRLNRPVPPSSTIWRCGLLAIVAIFILTTLIESLSIPLFEGPDEQRHYAYARYMVNNHSLPPRVKNWWNEMDYVSYQIGQETGQPPLYYIPVAILTAWLPHADDVDPLVVRNWFARYNDEWLLPNDNYNKYVHGLAEQFPYQGVALAVHLGRLVSIVAGACTLLAVYGIGRTVAPSHPAVALLGTALVAGVPGFIFIHSFITNDAFVILFATLSIGVALRIAREGYSLKLAILGGLFSGLTALSKLNGIWVAGIVWLALLAFAFIHRREKSFWSVLPALLLSIGVWLALTGWWFAFGISQSGDPLGVATHASYSWQSPLRIVIPQQQDWLHDLWEWDHFTWGINDAWPEWIYATFRSLYLIGTLMTMIFGARVLVRRRNQLVGIQQATYLGLTIAFALLGGLYWQLVYNWRLGRLLYPALASAAILAAAGWVWGFNHLRKHPLSQVAHWGFAASIVLVMQGASTAGVMNAIGTYSPHTVSPQSLANLKQTRLTFVDPTDGATPVAAVTGYDVPPQNVRAGGVMTATICWESMGYTRANYPYALQLVGPGDVQPGTRNSYHGLGNYPLATWKPNEEFCDPTSLAVSAGMIDKPRAYDLVLTLFKIEPPGLTVRSVLTAYDGEHRQVHPVIARVRVAPEQQSTVTPTIRLGDVAGLAGSSIKLLPTNILSVSLRWVALSSPNLNAKVFMHAVDKSTGKVIAQSDHEPDAGWFPTNYWQKGDVIDDQFEIALPAGTRPDDVNLRLGMYDSQSQARLPAIDLATQQRFADDAVPLTP